MQEGMSLPKYESNRGTTHLARIARAILGPCMDVLREVLAKEISPPVLEKKVKDYISENRKPSISEKQKQLVYSKNYSDFDITLLYFLFRNICSISQHENKWGRDPKPTDKGVSANIERVRILRNEWYGHATVFSLSDSDFKQKWTYISQIVKELECYLGTGTKYQNTLIALKTCFMDPESIELYIDTLLTDITDLKEGFGELQTDVTNIKESFGEFQTDVTSLKEDVEVIKKTHEKYSTQESQPLRPMLSPTLPPVNAAFIPPAPFMPTPSRASLNTESLSTKAGGVYNRSLPELPLDFKYIISSRRLQIQEKQLGSGHYGVVKEGMLFASQDDRSNPQKIAAKELKGDFQNVIDSEEFKEEAVLMSKLEHDNVVKFLGISDNMLILEYVKKGALNMYLRKFRKRNTYLPVWRLMKMISDVAQGMAYLASMRVIHCDLAGRNVLLTDKLVAKITDFGLAKILQKDKDYYTRSTGKELPLMWCSPESIANRKFTTKGDIWSYGILMWEVFTHAKPPVLCSNFSKEGFKKLEEGKRLKRPTHCPELVYQFMEKCWKFKPEERPDFNEACQSCREFAKIYPEPEQRVPDPPPDVPPGVSEPKKEKLTVPPDDKKLPASDNLKYMINTNLIRLEEKIIGKGHFGSVKRGTYTLKGKDIPIAVKVFQAMQRDMIEKEMFKEVDVLGALDNPHIVKLHGFTKKPDIMMIMEYVENGSLKNYLDQTRTSGGRVPESRLIAIVIDIVKGMEYLSEVKVLHCDLAARNILLTKDYMAKIADFGLSKLMTGDKDYYTRKGQDFIPLMWCAPEVIDKTKYSSKTDVWSFGVVLWECFSQGQTPKIFDVGDKELRKVTYYYLEKGGRLTKPSGCHDEVYDLMQKCWEWEADKRPPFNQIFVRCLQLQEMLGKA